ncbi:MAG TPA: hypothetical protein PKY59_22360 [Pyrinomonadaceae bacterium]|nr:hypothetical protein [Pyrinomonadaceae bacterium]
MIKLIRTRTHPPIHPNFCGAKRIEINLKLLKQKRDGELEKKGEKKWNSAIWKESKLQLLIESKNKCAYCETPTRVVAYGDVEHFRPKSFYWWLVYSYENYLPSCGACNQEYKKDFFDLDDTTKKLKGPQILSTMTDAELEELAALLTVDPVDEHAGAALADFIKETGDETALLINPYFEDPAQILAYRPILETREVVVVAAKPAYEKRIRACEKLFGINRKELLDLRFEKYATYMTFRHSLEDAGISAATRNSIRNRIDALKADDSAYAGMLRYFEDKPLSALPWNFDI